MTGAGPTIFKSRTRPEGYSVIDNRVFRDPRLPLVARGLLAFMLHKPADWRFTIGVLARETGESEYAITGHLKRLRDCGYVQLKQIRTSDGRRVARWTYVVVEDPGAEQPEPHFDAVSQDVEFRGCRDPEPPKSAQKPTPPEPLLCEIQGVDTLSVTKYQSSPLPPSGGQTVCERAETGRGEPAKPADPPTEKPTSRFNEFWHRYPATARKVGRKACRQLWIDEDLEAIADRVLLAVDRATQSEQWRKDGGRYIENPVNWLKKEPWDCESPICAGRGLADLPPQSEPRFWNF